MVMSRDKSNSKNHRRRLKAAGTGEKKDRRAVKKALASKPNASPSSSHPVWANAKTALAALGMLSLIGAGQLNRGDKLVAPILSFSAPGLSSRSGGQDVWAHNIWSNSVAPSLSPANSATSLLPPTSLSLVQAEESAAEISGALAESATPEQWASVGAIGMPRDWLTGNLSAHQPARPRLVLTTSRLFPPPALRPGPHWERFALVQAGSLGMTVLGFQKFNQFFGGPQKTFRAGNDWTKDRTLHFDELIHFQGGYRITQGLIGMYRWAGLNTAWSEGLGAGTAASVMTLLEYIDGRRPKPKQGASYSDFTANLLGVGFALAKQHVDLLQDVDLRLNYTAFGDVFHKKTLLKYDRMTHWLTYDLKRRWQVPLHIGVGYGVHNAFKPSVRSEYYLGVGFTPVEILQRYYPAAAKPFAWLGMYHIGWQVQVK